MPRLLEPLWLILVTLSERKLAQTVEYLREENRILRDKLPDRITVTPRERARLVKFGRPLGSAVAGLISIVSPRTFARWAKGERPARRPRRPPGRPRTEADVRKVVLRLAGETGWGYSRILGELRKLGVQSVSRSTVINILRDAGLDPGPKRGVGTWTDFLQRHAATLWASDFLTVKTWTTRGIVDVFVLFFLHPGSRRAFVAGVTASPSPDWVKQQARNATMRMEEMGLPPRYLLIDHDGKYTKDFDAVFAAEGGVVQRVGPKAPNLNAHAERFAQTLRQELLDHFVVFGEKHLRHLLTEFLTHYNSERPHQGIGNVPLTEDPPGVLPFPRGRVQCRKRLGGLLRHYHRAAA
jgi:putative transposase